MPSTKPQVTTCSHLLVFCADPDYDGLIRRLDGLLASNGVPAPLVPVMLCPIGYGVDEPGPKLRQPIVELLT